MYPDHLTASRPVFEMGGFSIKVCLFEQASRWTWRVFTIRHVGASRPVPVSLRRERQHHRHHKPARLDQEGQRHLHRQPYRRR